MSERVPMVCENCGQDLWIRLQNVGRIGKCRYCGHLFRARIDEVLDLQPTPPARVAKAVNESRGGKEDSRQRLARDPLIVLPQDQGARTPVDLEPRADRSPPSERRWEAAHSPISEFRAELTALRDRATQVDQLKQRLQTELTEIEQILAQIQEAQAKTSDPEAQAALERVREVEALRGDCHRDRKSTRLNSSHAITSRMPSSA